MLVKRIERTASGAEVSSSITRCACCGKPMMGLSKLGHADVNDNTLCPECMNHQLKNDNPKDR